MAVYWRGVTTKGSGMALLYCSFPIGLLAFGINDITDKDIDIHNPRKGGIDVALILTSDIPLVRRSTSLVTLLFIILFTLSKHYLSVLAILGIVIFCISYSAKPLRLKAWLFIDSISNGLALILVFLMGFFVSQTGVSADWPPTSLILISFLGGTAFHALGTILDYDTDIKARQKTMASVLGKKRTVLLAFCLLLPAFLLTDPAEITLRVFFGVCTALNLLLYFNQKAEFIHRLKLVFFFLLLAPLPGLFLITHL